MFIEYLIESYNKKWYHASSANFDEFDITKSDMGIHFGNKNQANYINNNRINNKTGNNILYHVNLKIYNPLRLKDLGCFHADCISKQLYNKGIISQEEHDILNNYINRKENNEFVRNRLIKKGYDGIIYRNNHEGSGDSIIAIKHNTINIVKKENI